ncbi:MAG: ADP-ribosylglycohydrolase family protein [Planctomycetota bacterium]
MQWVLLGLLVGIVACTAPAREDSPAPPFRRLPVATYRDKMEAGWLGQMVGVSWGAPTEFHHQGSIIPPDEMPLWRDGLENDAFAQDDLYVEMTFLRTLEQHGISVSGHQAGIDFAMSLYPLWHANAAGRNNLRAGVAPPDSGHPQLNEHADDIDYQIEADFSGLIAPGLPNRVIALGETFGRLMNYGDGLYAGQFIGGMYAEAFFVKEPAHLVQAGLRCIPAASQYAEAIRDVLAWHRENPTDWEATWKKIEEKYNRKAEYRKFCCAGTGPGGFNIDAKLNGAYVVLGLLYGEGDLEETILIATRAGQDSDCNPSSAAGVLFTTLGLASLPERYSRGLDRERMFLHTEYSVTRLVAVCEKLARESVLHAGGRIEIDAKGEEVFLIPLEPPRPSALEQSWAPGPIAGSRYSEEEMARITAAVARTASE